MFAFITKYFKSVQIPQSLMLLDFPPSLQAVHCKHYWPDVKFLQQWGRPNDQVTTGLIVLVTFY